MGVRSSRYGKPPRRGLEAMAIGAPRGSTDVTGIPEVIRNGETGLVGGQHDAKQLADAIGRLLDDASRQVRLAQGARKLIEQDFDIHANTAQLGALFSEAIASGGRISA